MNAMREPLFSYRRFLDFPAVCILRGFDVATVREMGRRSFDLGITTIEVTMNTEGALEQIAALREEAGMDGNVGAGTVLTLDQLEAALGAGASFVVTPVVNEAVIEACAERDVPVIPGAFTPTEIWRAWDAGASMVKVFPAESGGVRHFKWVRGPLNAIPLVAVGGISEANAEAYLAAGATGIGIGGGFYDEAAIARGEWDWLGQKTRVLREIFDRYPVKDPRLARQNRVAIS